MSAPTGAFVAMSHESHGFCFCGDVHCGNGQACDSATEHEGNRA